MNEAPLRALLCLRFAVRSLWKRRRQFVLLYLTLMTAFWFSFTIAGIMSGTQGEMRRNLERIGLDVINVHAPVDPFRFLRHGLTIGECDRFASLVSGVAAPANLQPAMARAGPGETPGAEEAVLVIGTTPAWDDVLRLQFAAGRFFRDDETSVCVVDQWAFRRLFPERASLRGDEAIELKIADQWKPFRIVGVVSDPYRIRERFEDWDATGLVRSYILRFMEYKNVYVPRSSIASGDGILAAVVRVGQGVDPTSGALKISGYLRRKGSTAVAWSRKEWVGHMLEAGDNLSALSNFIWVVVLLVTAFMVVSVVFIIVRQRFPEIAVRRVEGATALQIAWQLIAENLLLTLLAAVLGLAFAELSCLWIEREFLGWPVRVFPSNVVVVGTVGAAIILLTTVLPARRAAALDPVRVLQKR